MGSADAPHYGRDLCQNNGPSSDPSSGHSEDPSSGNRSKLELCSISKCMLPTMTPGLLLQVSAPARRLLSWRHKIEAKAVDIYFGRRRVIHASNWLVKVWSPFINGSCLVHHAAARGLHENPAWQQPVARVPIPSLLLACCI